MIMANRQINFYHRMTNVVLVDLGYDVSGDILTSQIRRGTHVTTEKVADWTVEFVTDGTDGKLRLTIDDSVEVDPTTDMGYMDMKRMIGGANGEPVPVFDGPILVNFVDVVTE
jgi:hypothetical protein